MEQNARYRVVFYGELVEGQKHEDVKKQLESMFRLSPDRFEAVFTGKPLIVKEDIGRNEALKYKAAFERAGAQCRILPQKPKSAQGSSGAPQKTGKPVPKKTSSKKKRPHRLFFQPGIPQELLDDAIRTYAGTFRQGEEDARMLIDLGPSGAALLLSDRRLYLRRVNAPPRTIKLSSIRSVEHKQNKLLINKQPLLLLPQQLQQQLPVVIEAINSAVTEAALHPVAEEPLAPQPVETQESRGGSILKFIVAATLAIVVLGVGFQFFRHSKKEEQTPEPISAEIGEEDGDASSGTPDNSSPSDVSSAKKPSCEQFAYTIQGGESAALEFIQEYKGGKLEDAANIYEVAMNQLDRHGYSVSISGPFVSIATIEGWMVDGIMMFNSLKGEPSCKAVDENNFQSRPSCIPRTHTWRDFAIYWKDDGYGLITRFSDVHGVVKIARLSEEDIGKKLSPDGSMPTIEYGVQFQRGVALNKKTSASIRSGAAGAWKTFTLNVIKSYGVEIPVQNFSVSISVPEKVEHSNQYNLKFTPYQGKGSPLYLLVRTDSSNNRIRVIGPRLTGDCL